jgi:ferrous iron transport protein B
VVPYHPDIEQEIARLVHVIEQQAPSFAVSPRWLAIQLLEGDESIRETLRQTAAGEAILQTLQSSITRLRQTYGDHLDIALTSQRYTFVHTVVQQVVARPDKPTTTFSDRIDAIATHQYMGIVFFLALMWVVFKLTTDVASPFLDWIDGLISGSVTHWTRALLHMVGLGGSWVEGLFVNGMLIGVGGVLVFLPVLMSLYFALAVLEDSGYMARAAFVMHRLMQKLGLHGKSFLPMIVGFGCTVPALSATRTLDNERDRILTGLLVPFMSCGGRLPVYGLMASIFFPQNGGIVIFALYLTGIFIAIVLGFILNRTIFQSDEYVPFIMELAPYRMPTWTNIWRYMWDRTAAFLHNAATVILVGSIVVWLLGAIPTTKEQQFAHTPLNQSLFGAISQTISPLFAAHGFGSRETTGALISGVVAKEMIISTLAQTYGLEQGQDKAETAPPAVNIGADLRDIAGGFVLATRDTILSIPLIIGISIQLDDEHGGDDEPSRIATPILYGFEQSSAGHGWLASVAFMVFVLLYTPCLPAIAALRQEIGKRWMWVSIIGQFVVAWGVSLLVFQVGKALFF